MKALIPVFAAICVVACRPPAFAERPAAHQHLGFVQASCGGCHAVARYGDSPNANAPPFAAIANTPGLTRQTLSSWLGDAHNYPEEMEFSLDDGEVDDLVAYMLTLRSSTYRPPI